MLTAPHDPILTALETRLREVMKQEHQRGTLIRYDYDDLMADVNTHRTKLYLSDKTGRDAKVRSEVVVPDANGWRMELRLVPGPYNGQAVRPQTVAVSHHNQAGQAVSWNEYLDQYWLKAANVTLLFNLDYGKQLKPGLLARLKAAVQSEAKKAANQ